MAKTKTITKQRAPRKGIVKHRVCRHTKTGEVYNHTGKKCKAKYKTVEWRPVKSNRYLLQYVAKPKTRPDPDHYYHDSFLDSEYTFPGASNFPDKRRAEWKAESEFGFPPRNGEIYSMKDVEKWKSFHPRAKSMPEIVKHVYDYYKNKKTSR